MFEDPFNNSSGQDRNGEEVKTDLDPPASVPHHKSKAFKSFFRKSPSNNDGVTPRSESAAAGRLNSGRQAAVPRIPEEDDWEDHMRGSAFLPTDVCKACGFPRGSSVCCPVTRRHHGTDELMTPGRHHHSRTTSGSTNIFTKLREKLPGSGRRANKATAEGETPDHTPQTNELPPLSLSTSAVVNSASRATPQAALTPQSFANDEPASAAGAQESPDVPLDAYAAPDSPADADEVQYFSYTDENGDTYYYAKELHDSVHQATQAPAAAADAIGEESGDPGAAATEEICIYEVVDENGNTVQYTNSPQADGGEGESGQQADATAPLDVQPGDSDAANSSEVEETATVSSAKKKTPNAFFSSLTRVFRTKKAEKDEHSKHEDPAHMGKLRDPATSTPPDAALASGAGAAPATTADSTTTMISIAEIQEHDNAIVDFMNTLEPSEKKKFTKERKHLIKELSTSEKKERVSIAKARQDGMSAFAREKLSGAFALRKDERTIKLGQKSGEPL